MGRPKVGYEIDGEKVPGVTSILSRFKDSGALIHWAYTQGKEGKDFRETKQKAADAGTLAHDLVEADLYGATVDLAGIDQDVVDKAQGAFKAYKEWKAQTHLEVVETETPLVSRKFRFGGTPDAMAVRGDLALLDWKTSNGVYSDYILQLAAYQILWEENHPDRPIKGGCHLLRFSKPTHPSDPVSFTHHYWSHLDVAKDQFLLLLEAYRLDKRVKGLL